MIRDSHRSLPDRKAKISTKVRWLLGALVVVVAALGVPLLNSEIRSFLLFKVTTEYARDAHFLRLTANGQDVYLLGTIHGDHLTSEAYTLGHIQALVENLKPDLLLVESRPEELARGNWADGPIEMPVASLTARANNIPVAGIDWWQKSGSKPGTSSPERDDRMAQNVLQRLPGRRTVLILVGYSHVAELSHRLEAAGYVVVRFERGAKRNLFSTTAKSPTFPLGLKQAVQKYVDQLEKELDQETDADWQSAMERSIALRQRLIERIDRTGERSSVSTRPPGRHAHDTSK